MAIEKFLVITTINAPNDAIKKFAALGDWQIVLIGDRKSPVCERAPMDRVTFLSIEDQKSLGFRVHDELPYNHYGRKNLGYLYALKQGARIIADTDDDNIPYPNWGSIVTKPSPASFAVAGCDYFNIYAPFTNEFVWPRGFPLNRLQQNNEAFLSRENGQLDDVAVWQGLADLDPDVDAIHRLVFAKEIKFAKHPPVVLNQGVYCPFNSQNTIWSSDVFPLLYLPVDVSFRFTDILRGYVAQPCLWKLGKRLGFTEATVYQERNLHNLMRDFESEIPVYTQIERVVEIMSALELAGDPASNLQSIYNALCTDGITTEKENSVIEAWIEDVGQFSQ